MRSEERDIKSLECKQLISINNPRSSIQFAVSQLAQRLCLLKKIKDDNSDHPTHYKLEVHTGVLGRVKYNGFKGGWVWL